MSDRTFSDNPDQATNRRKFTSVDHFFNHIRRMVTPTNETTTILTHERNLRILWQEWHKMWRKQHFETGSWKRGDERDGNMVIATAWQVRRRVYDMATARYHENYLAEIEGYWLENTSDDVELHGAPWEWVSQRSLGLVCDNKKSFSPVRWVGRRN